MNVRRGPYLCKLEQRLAMSVAVEPKADEAGPIALEDDERSFIVPAPQLADFIAAIVDHVEVLFLFGAGRDVEAELDVQVLLHPRLGRGGRARPGNVQFGYFGDVPRRGILHHGAGLVGQH
jgi:hypothetical protein